MIIPCLIAVMLLVTHSLDGVALSMDSLYYLRTARHLLDGNGVAQQTFAFVGQSLEPMTVWPPGYPVALAGSIATADVFGISERAAVTFLNAGWLIVALVLLHRIASRVVAAPVAAVFASLVALAPSSQLIHVYAWSEVVFIPLSLAGYLYLLRAADQSDVERHPVRALMLSVFFFLLATYVRYVGLAFFGAAMMIVMIFGVDDFSKRLKRVTIASAAYGVALIPLFWRNLSASGAFSGADRGSRNIDLHSDIGTLGTYLYLEFLNVVPAIGIGAIALSVTIAITVLRRRKTSSENPAYDRPDISFVVAPVIISACYLAFLVVSRQLQAIDLDTRMIGVVVPFLFLAFLGVYAFLANRVGPAVAAAPFIVPMALLLFNAIGTHKQIIDGWRQSGEPGRVLAMTYPSISANRFDVLRGISQHFAVPDGATVFTDLSRPIVIQYLFPNATVRQLPALSDPDSLLHLDKQVVDRGLIIVSTSHWWSALQERYQSRATLMPVVGESGGPEWLVIALPFEKG